jgi:hypothetical protein
LILWLTSVHVSGGPPSGAVRDEAHIGAAVGCAPDAIDRDVHGGRFCGRRPAASAQRGYIRGMLEGRHA